jgi:hypothetical protein
MAYIPAGVNRRIFLVLKSVLGRSCGIFVASSLLTASVMLTTGCTSPSHRPASAKSSSVRSQNFNFDTTGDLYRICTTPSGDPNGRAAAFACRAFVEATVQYHDQISDRRAMKRLICYPSNTTIRDGTRAFSTWAANNANDRSVMSEIPVLGVVRALSEGYPCKEGPSINTVQTPAVPTGNSVRPPTTASEPTRAETVPNSRPIAVRCTFRPQHVQFSCNDEARTNLIVEVISEGRPVPGADVTVEGGGCGAYEDIIRGSTDGRGVFQATCTFGIGGSNPCDTYRAGSPEIVSPARVTARAPGSGEAYTRCAWTAQVPF